MAKSSYICNSCGSVFTKWLGKCTNCGEWNSIYEDKDNISQNNSKLKKSISSGASSAEIVKLKSEILNYDRRKTGIEEFDRVLGGGIVEGAACLIAGDPGIGKSTLLLQLVANLSSNNAKTLYITAEESLQQVQMRARRLGLEESNVDLASVTSLSDIIATIKKSSPDILVIDSIQTIYLDTIESSPGTVSQVRQCANALIQLIKSSGIALFLVGHVTKEGMLAGPKTLEHMVDSVLYFEGEKGGQYRILRSIKNRFGAANEIGVFEMYEQGLKQVANPSAIFMGSNAGQVSGSALMAAMEGTRPIIVEVQALVASSPMATPRRSVVGWDANRLAMILAVLQTRCGLRLADKEVYLNIAGGIKVNEPAADLAVAAAIISAISNIPIKQNHVIFGEIGLTGEIRQVNRSDIRLKEAKKLGFQGAITPTLETAPKIKTEQVEYIADLKNAIF